MPRAPQTWRALTHPRRALPIALVALALLATEWWASRSAAALLVDLALVVVFALVAPASWRWLCSGARSRGPGPARALGVAAYLALVAVVVGTVGVALPSVLGLPGTYVADPSSLGVVVALFAVGGWGLGRDIELELGLDAAQAETERAQILALRAHLDPHFLFNTLNAIAEWCREDPLVAETATLRLASMLRVILAGIRTPTWSLARELDLVRELFALYEIRDGEKYRFVVDVPLALPDVAVPPMLLLPLCENAITHGPAAGHAGAVTLTVRRTPDGATLVLRNPGRYAGRRRGGEGIAIVERRLALAYAGRARLSLQTEDESTLTTLALPRAPSIEEGPQPSAAVLTR